MGFQHAISNGITNFINFSGRASRSEYWYWVLFTCAAAVVLSVAAQAIPAAAGTLGLLSLALIPPAFSVCVRRLHDLDKSGWQYFVVLIPFIGTLVMFVWFCTKGTDGVNRFGKNPLAMAS